MPLLDSALAVLAVSLWGVNFIAAKVGMEYFAPFFLTGVRFALVGGLMVWFFPLPNRVQWVQLLKLSTVMGVLQFSTMYVAIDMGLNISSIAIVGQMGVPFSCLLGAIFLHDRLGIWRISGLILAFAGMVIVAGTPNIAEHPLAFLIAIFSSFCWGVGNIMVKRMHSIASMPMLVWMALLSAPQLFVVSIFLEGNQWQGLPGAPLSAWLALAYTVIFSTVVAYGLWYYLIKKHPVTQVAPYSLLTPVTGIACGQLYFHETLTPMMIVGGLIVIIGVAIIVMRRPKLVARGESI